MLVRIFVILVIGCPAGFFRALPHSVTGTNGFELLKEVKYIISIIIKKNSKNYKPTMASGAVGNESEPCLGECCYPFTFFG